MQHDVAAALMREVGAQEAPSQDSALANFISSERYRVMQRSGSVAGLRGTDRPSTDFEDLESALRALLVRDPQPVEHGELNGRSGGWSIDASDRRTALSAGECISLKMLGWVSTF